MRRHLILLGLLAIAAVTLMAGCSADEIMSAGQTMGSLGSAGLGKAGEAVVSDTAKTVEAFVGKYESCLRLPERLFQVPIQVAFLTPHEQEVFEDRMLSALRQARTEEI